MARFSTGLNLQHPLVVCVELFLLQWAWVQLKDESFGPTPVTAGMKDFDSCRRLFCILVVHHSSGCLISAKEWIAPIRYTTYFPFNAAMYSASCGVYSFLIMLLLGSWFNPIENPTGIAPCALACMSPFAFWCHLLWLCVSFTRLVAILMLTIYHRAQTFGQIEDAELSAASMWYYLQNNENRLAASTKRGLTHAQLQEMPTFSYNDAGNMSTQSATTNIQSAHRECGICLEDYIPEQMLKRLPKCGHVFHQPCLDAWLALRNHCPYCRCIAVVE